MRSGFVSIIGRPNAGKSTLLNALVGEKLAIVTHKPQTTRNRICGIVNLKRSGRRPAAQIIFVDTPGIHKPADALNQRMMQEVHNAVEGCSLLLLIVDAAQKFAARGGVEDQFALGLVKRSKLKTFLLLNKIDLIAKGDLLPIIERYSALHSFAEVIPISAAKKDGLDLLLNKVAANLPEGPQYFPPDQVTDQPERFVAAELIREQLLVLTQQEVPYSSTVIVEQFEESEKLVKIAAVIYVERQGQKAIVIGRQGAMLKQIGTRARLAIERLLNKKVFLELFIKVRSGWRESRQFVDELDWRKQLQSLSSRDPKPSE
jgi:GTP-binding protein Era